MRPEIDSSTKDMRKNWISDHFRCISDCDLCGICAVYKGKDPVLVYADYIEGKRSFEEITAEYH